MNRPTQEQWREEQAKRELGYTRFARGAASTLAAGFLAILVGGAAIQHLLPARGFARLLRATSEVEAAPHATDPIHVSGRIAAVSRPPRRTAVYRDFTMQMHLVDVEASSGGALTSPELLVTVMGMRHRAILPAAGWRPGRRVELRLYPWDTVAERVAGLNGSLLDGDRFLTMPRWWAEPASGAHGRLPRGTDCYCIWTDPPVRVTDVVEEGAGILARLFAANRQLLQRIDLYERAVDDLAVPGLLLRSPAQYLLSVFGAGNEKVFLGRKGWLFFVPAIDYLVGAPFLDRDELTRRRRDVDVQADAPRPDPRPVMLEFHRELAARGIELVLLPVPVKAGVHPEYLTSKLAAGTGVLRNPSFAGLTEELAVAGVQCFDAAPALRDVADREPAFLATDTHWRPVAMQAVASALAERLHDMLPDRAPADWRTNVSTQVQAGDLAAALELPDWQSIIGPETATVTRVVAPDGRDWAPDPRADVLVLGDSFVNIYSLEGMGWGQSAGFAEHLSLALDRPVNRLSRNDAGARASRELLVRELERDPQFLDAVRVIVWEFSERELAVGDWPELPLPDSPDPPPSPVPDDADGFAVLAELVAAAEGDGAAAIAGDDEWLFLVSELRGLVSPPHPGPRPGQPEADPFSAIVDLHAKLDALGIRLLLVPVPPRAVVYAEHLPVLTEGRLDAGLQAFYSALRTAGVQVLDLTDAFLDAKSRDGEAGPVCCPQDTHWSPRGIALAADEIAAALGDVDLAPGVEEGRPTRLPTEPITYVGDLAGRVPGHTPSATTALVSRVDLRDVSVEGPLTDGDSPVLLLTDSHGLVFSAGGDMHTTGAGLPEQLAVELGFPVDVMARRGSGASVRRDLARRFLRDASVAAGKRVVVYCFAARMLSEESGWKPVPLKRKSSR